MAATQKDLMNRERIKNLMVQLKGTDKEIINQIAGIVGISFRTAREHYNIAKSQQKLTNLGFNEKCPHSWSNAFMTAGGLVKECNLCHETRRVNL